MRWLDGLARVCAMLAGLLLTGVALLTCASILGREILGRTLLGDFELAGAASGIAIALLMPICHLRGGNIIVDAFTTRASPATTARLDRAGAFGMACLMGLLAWRTAIGGHSAWVAQSASMLMGLPEWIVYAGMAPPFALTALIALHQAIWGLPPEGAAA